MLSDGDRHDISGASVPVSDEASLQEPTWQGPLVMLGLVVGILLMGLQLWLLTLAFNLYLSGERGSVVLAAVISGLVFLGGLGMLLVLDRTTVKRGAGRAPARRRNE